MEPTALAWAVLGISATGFFFLASWIRSLTDKNILAELKEIRLALTGDIDKPGIVTRIHEHDCDIKAMKRFCEQTHNVPRAA